MCGKMRRELRKDWLFYVAVAVFFAWVPFIPWLPISLGVGPVLVCLLAGCVLIIAWWVQYERRPSPPPRLIKLEPGDYEKVKDHWKFLPGYGWILVMDDEDMKKFEEEKAREKIKELEQKGA